MDEAAEPWEIARDLTQKQYKSLAALRNLGSEARTPEVTGAVEGLYAQIVNQHYQKMIGAALVEKVDEGRGNGSHPLPREGFKYRVTDRVARSSRRPKRSTDCHSRKSAQSASASTVSRVGSARSNSRSTDSPRPAPATNLAERVDMLE